MCKYIYGICVVLVWLILGSPGQAHNTVEAVIEELFPRANVGIYVAPLSPDTPLVSIQGDKLMVPSSILKLVTVFTGLKVLGPDFTFKTQIFVEGQTLYLKFSGDPSLTKEDLRAMVRALRLKMPKASFTKLVIDTSAVPFPQQAPTWMVEDTLFCYGAPVRAVVIDNNEARFTLNPSKSGQLARITVDNNPQNFQVINKVKTHTCPANEKVKECEVDRIDFPAQKNGTEIYGGLDRYKTDLRLCFPIWDQEEGIKQVMSALFQEEKMTIPSKVVPGKAPKTMQALVTHSSLPLRTLVGPVLRNSHNLYADAIFLQTALQLNPRINKWEEAGDEIKKFLQTVIPHMNSEDCIIVDGSGISRNQLIAPRQLTQLLQMAYQDPSLWEILESHLPCPGKDGSLKKRLKAWPQQVLAKTGAQSGVLSLSGVFYPQPKKPLFFTIMVNHFTTPIKETFPKLDFLANAVFNYVAKR